MADKSTVVAAIAAITAALPPLTEEHEGHGQGPDQQRLNIADVVAKVAAAAAEADALP